MRTKACPVCDGCSNRGAFPGDEAISNALYLGLCNVAETWTQPRQNRADALNRFAMLHHERLAASAA
jgi:transposase-like protein